MKKSEQSTSDKNTKFRITIEPAGFLLVTAGVIQAIVHQNSYLNKFCRVNFQLNVTSCDLRNRSGDTHESEDDEMAQISDRIQSSVSSLLMWASLIETLPAILFVLFLGPWSNQHGRKPLMILPLTGNILSIMIYMLVNYADSLTAEYLLFASLPVGMTGGFNTLMMATHSYLADISTENSRTSRLSLFTGMISISVPAASYASVHIYNFGGEWAVWWTSLGLTIVALFYVIFFVSESRSIRKPPDTKEYLEKKESSSFVNRHCLPHLASLLHCFVVTFRPRMGYNRACLVLMIIMSCLSSFSFAPSTMAYLYVRKKFEWDAPDFAMYGVVVSVVPVFGTLLILPLLSSYLKMNDLIIGIISLLGNIVASVTFAFATSSLMLYLSSLGSLLTVGIGVVINSTISKIVGIEEIGYVYPVTACITSIVPLFASASVKLIYMATLDFFPGFVFIFGAFLDSIMIFLLIVELVLQKKDTSVDPVIGISFKFRESFQN